MMPVLSDRILRGLAWSISVLVIVLMYAGLTLQIITASPFYGAPMLVHFSEVFSLTVYAVVGALIVSRHLRHPVGWIWMLIAASFGLDHFVWGYAAYGYIAHPASLPGLGIAFFWIFSLGRGTLGMLGMVLLLLVFPTGQPLSRRWGVIAWIALGAVVVMIPILAFVPSIVGSFPFPNGLLALGDPARAVLVPLRTAALILVLLCVVAAMISLIIRFRRSRNVERQQIKWFAYSAVFVIPALLLISISANLQPPSSDWAFLLGAVFGILFGVGNAAASAIAILRYRLYDIDVIIRRTLVYGALTVTLALVYLASIVLLQGLFVAFSGQRSAVAVVISTLVIAALFTPLRWRIQNDIDRRFYRRKYDAEKVAEAFSAGLREEVDIEQLSEHLLAVVEETLQPESLSLWLKEQ